MKPVIGITSSMETDCSQYTINNRNIRAIENAGGIPVMLPYLKEKEDINHMMNKLDGLYLTGGYDIDPTLFGEEPLPGLGTIIPERDRSEIAYIERMIETDKPILGVCRGSQILNIAIGGSMYQDIYTQLDTSTLLQHQQKAPFGHRSHFVNVKEDSLLFQLTGMDKFKVNSYHHQTNNRVPKDYQICATASDGIIEAFESTNHRFVLGLQWHPEGLIDYKEDPSLSIYQGFIKACIDQ
ncbi:MULTISPECIES: gamma-glutamyl-gamma-aminobutyrate hydrolase family protein [Oceanobacillus]|uniref:Peptidase C26 n=1 Tax=Oceanobacillus kimchii TaxID=746691 RepID=A0ABQ5TKW8_9BACI|nr:MULTISPECIES: gamma-glutamyl-gamma-aminobutyrate hydrolase family protein [Oceanobacillus]MBT2600581.1 gamma-glutamyl-gamma-aminobutyrate hydrolase family protein [Oceanobacillus sp. ISL-74]MBT2651022.1 gamma-glutamyl-gamma-aminobutyrate hydrolase family protein [Oceanobacillus sp. ISL-73]GLO65187.1 peptidase C26 [Oceanobacillus kimchii]